jgi:hypothetical protein
VQVDWSLIDSAVKRLGSLTKLPISLGLLLSSLPGIDERRPELQEMMTSRVLRLIERLATLKQQIQFGGIREVCIERPTIGEAELAALGDVVGHTCRRLIFHGFPEGLPRKHVAATVPKYLPHVKHLKFIP